MATTAQSPVIPIPMQDEIIHTLESPYCNDPDCPCKEELAEQEARAERRYISSLQGAFLNVLEHFSKKQWARALGFEPRNNGSKDPVSEQLFSLDKEQGVWYRKCLGEQFFGIRQRFTGDK